MSSSNGISSRHGLHQVAQKLIMTTWPLNWDRSTPKPLRPESWNAGAGPEEVAAKAGSTNATASARPFVNPFTVRADMLLTPSEEDGRAEQGLDVVGDLVLA